MFEELLSRLARSLDNKAIPYMIIGGQAVLLYGEPRLTRDIDITLGITTDHLKEIVQITEDIPLKILPEDVYEFVGKTMVLPTLHEDTGIRIDFIFSFTPYEQEAIQRVRLIPIKGTVVKFASPEDVIIHKIFAGRPRDIEDVRGIILKNPELDLRYIERWLKEFENSVGGDFLQVFKEILKSV